MRRDTAVVVASVILAYAIGGLVLLAAVHHATRPKAAPAPAIVALPPSTALEPSLGLKETFTVAERLKFQDDLFHPGVTTAFEPPLLAVAGEAPVQSASFGGDAMSESEAEAVLRAAGAPEAWIPAFLVIGRCESHFRARAVGGIRSIIGWLQIWSGWAAEGEDLFDPLTSARVGIRIRETRGRFGGTGGWQCADLNGIP